VETVRTNVLEVAYEEGGPQDGPVAVLLHGWPDGLRAWRLVAERLHAAGWHTVAPYLRGTGSTRFLYSHTPRVGSGVALAQDVIDLADTLNLGRFAVVGHDWGARVAYTLAALFPDRIQSVGALSLAFQPSGEFLVPPFEQSRRFWYQWFLCTDGGLAKVHADPVGFARIQWETWSPAGWFEESEFLETSKSFLNPDWLAITANAYRSRWLEGEAADSSYEPLTQKLRAIQAIHSPTLMIQGSSDFCDGPDESEGLEAYFTGPYKRVLLNGVGHFPHREDPDAVATHVLNHLDAFNS
jgi:pimeloyl-ACP methyl ester carboxylesterase